MIVNHRMRRALLGFSVTAAVLSAVASPWALAETVPVEVQRGITNYNKGWLGKAIPEFEEAARKHPNNELAHLWLARAYKKQGEFDKAKLSFARLIELNPDNVEALAALGEIYSWDVSRREEAIDLLRRAAMLSPGNVDIKKRLSEVLHWTGRNEEAFDYAQSVASAQGSGNDKEWLKTYARILVATGHSGNAVTIYEDFLDIESSSDIAMKVSYAEALAKSGNTLQAGDLYETLKPEVLALDNSTPDNVNLKKAMGGLAFTLDRHWDAIEFDQSLPEDIRLSRDTQLRTARAYVKTYRIPEAIETFNTQYQQGHLTATEKIEFADYLKSLSLPPESLPSPNIIEELYIQALQEDPNNPQAAHRLARIYAERGNVPEAARYFMQAYENWPQPVVGEEQIIPKAQVKTELLEFLKASAQGDPQNVEATLQALSAQYPGDYLIRGTYAEFLSYEPARRAEAMRMFVDLAREDAAHQDYWLFYLNRTLLWHEPTTELIPLYQEIVNTFPDNKPLWMSVARAYRNNPDYFYEALDLYSALKRKYPNDPIISDEWVGMIMSNQIKRKEAIRILQQAIAANPNDLSARTALGKLYSYDRDFKEALAEFDAVLAAQPNHKEALIAKGFTLIWQGKKLKAKEFLEYARSLHPGDVDVAVALAQANKRLGRYDEAFQIMDEIRPLLEDGNKRSDTAGDGDFIPVAYTHAAQPDAFGMANAVFDFSILPAALPAADDQHLLAYAPTPDNIIGSHTPAKNPTGKNLYPVIPPASYGVEPAMPDPRFKEDHSQPDIDDTETEPLNFYMVPVTTAPVQNIPVTTAPVQNTPVTTAPVQNIPVTTAPVQNTPVTTAPIQRTPVTREPVQNIPVTTAPVQSLIQHIPVAPASTPAMPAGARAYTPSPQPAPPRVSQDKIEDLQSEIDSLSMALESLTRVQEASENQMDKIDSLLSIQRESIPTEIAIHDRKSETVGNDGMMYGLFHSLPYDTQPLRSGLGRFRNDDLVQMEKGLINDLRPMIRVGYDWATQNGESTTSKWRYYGFPNELALSLTPQIRGRFSMDPYRYYIPGGKKREPWETWSQAYKWGFTAKPTDKLLLDGDMAVTHFNQSGSENITFEAGIRYDLNDAVSGRIYGFREPQFNSLLSIAGLKPDRGAFAGRLVGQARETGFGIEGNFNPFSENIDLNLGYEFAVVEGSRIPTNYKNLAFLSTGYTHWFNNDHRVRAAYEFVYFGYSHNTTNGFFDTTARGAVVPVVSLIPVTEAHPGYDFGGYYSPKWFIQNAWGLEFKGQILNNLFNYTIGGKLGVQNFGLGHGIDNDEPSPASMTKEAYADLIMNITDWLAAYGNVHYTDAGGAFERFQFGGGLILRPSIEFLSPVFRRRYPPLFTPQPTPPAVENIPTYPITPEQARLPEPLPEPEMPNIFVQPEPPPKKFVPGYW